MKGVKVSSFNVIERLEIVHVRVLRTLMNKVHVSFTNYNVNAINARLLQTLNIKILIY